MDNGGDSPTPGEIVEAERTAYREELPGPDSDWPQDVRVVYVKLLDRLFDWGGVEAQEILDDCGIGGHDAYSRFRHVTGHGIKGFVVHHRMQLAKRLLRYDALSISDVAFAVGYDSPSGFSKTFKRRVGRCPTVFREHGEG